MNGLVAPLCFAASGAILGRFLLARGWRVAGLGLLLLLGGVAAGLGWAGQRSEDLRSLAYLAVMTQAALPALLGAAIGEAVGWWQRRRHGA
jgi:hypothetical protein